MLSRLQVIMDNMMNLEVLWYSNEISPNSTLTDIAISHADKTLTNHVRADGTYTSCSSRWLSLTFLTQVRLSIWLSTTTRQVSWNNRPPPRGMLLTGTQILSLALFRLTIYSAPGPADKRGVSTGSLTVRITDQCYIFVPD